MAQTFQFPGAATALLSSSTTPPRRPHRAKRPTGNKLQEIAFRSPADMRAIDRIADLILARLNKHDAEHGTPITPYLATSNGGEA